MALDKALDSENCPVSYRKYFAAEWLVKRTWDDGPISFVQGFISSKDIDVKAICSTWYNNVYGHAVYEPPASRFIGLSTPVPIVVTLSPMDSEIILPDITLVQYEIKESLLRVLNADSFALQGMRNLQNLPMAKWVWLVMSDFDISVTSFTLSRPAYHLSLWHSFQALEKLLKSVLLSQGETESSVREYAHNLNKIVGVIGSLGIVFSERSNQIVDEISALVGGPSIRYIDDSYQNGERPLLSNKAIKAHHLFLEFLALEGIGISGILKDNPINSIHGSDPKETDHTLRTKVHSEHKKMCGHSAYSKPSDALPFRKDVVLQLQS